MSDKKGFLTRVKEVLFKPLSRGGFVPLNVINGIGLDGFEFGENRRDYVIDGYGKNPYVFSAINLIVERAQDIQFDIVDESGEIVNVLDPFFNTILNDPNEEGFQETLYRLLSNYLANECFVIEKRVLGSDRMTGFIVPNSQDVIINTDSNGRVESYDYSYFNNTLRAMPDQVLHIKRPNITNQLHNGISNLQAGRKPYEANNEVWSSEATLHKNKGINGVLFSKGNRPLENKEQKALQAEYDSQFASKSFGKVKVSKEELGYIRMGMNPADLQSLDTKIDHRHTISALYRVDPILLGDKSGSTYNNMREAKLGLITDAVLPTLRRVMPELFAWIGSKTGTSYFYKVNEDSIPELQTAKEMLSARIGREVIQGILTPAQALKMLHPELVVELDDQEGVISEEDSLSGDNQAQAENAQAQANLRGSVGGVQGILGIQQAVVSGTTSRESAIAILMQIYGFDEQAANEILG